MVRVCEDIFGKATNPSTYHSDEIRRFTLSNRCMSVQVISYGATITSIKIPDADGNVADIVLGFDSVEGYQTNANPYFGAVIGRVSGPIANGKFMLNSRDIQLTRNFLGKHQLHGGFIGFDKVIWDVHRVRSDGVVFSFCSPDGHEGYPGQVLARATYTLTEDNCFRYCLEATTNKPTPINMTNHSYFNLAGHDAGKAGLLEHMVLIRGNLCTATDEEHVPNGRTIDLTGKALDLHRMKNLGKILEAGLPEGFDHNYIVDYKCNTIKRQAQAYHPGSGRWMEISSNQPCLHFYTAHNLPNVEEGEKPTVFGKQGTKYSQHGAFCMLTQGYPNAINLPNFPTVIVHPGEKYQHICLIKFGIVHQKAENEQEAGHEHKQNPAAEDKPNDEAQNDKFYDPSEESSSMLL